MPRLYLTTREYDALLKRQRGKCCVRGCKATEGLIAEHSTPNAIHPGKPDQLHVQTMPQGEDAAGREGYRQDEAAEWDDDVSV